MNIVKIIGGLGNQMFQYAFYKAISLHSEDDTKIDIEGFKDYDLHNGYELEKIFGISNIHANRKQIQLIKDEWPFYKIRRKLNLLKKTHYIERNLFSYSSDIYKKRNMYFDGYWQNIQYVVDAEKEIRNDFEFCEPKDKRNINVLKEIRSNNSCSVHIRRGDYINHPTFKGICDENYYKKAIEYIETRVSNVKFYVFSNDIDWCKKFLIGDNFIFIDWNFGETSYIDMFLMKECKHNIISNSTFCWWSSWLNTNEGKITISPSKWTNNYQDNNLLLEEWIKLD